MKRTLLLPCLLVLTVMLLVGCGGSGGLGGSGGIGDGGSIRGRVLGNAAGGSPGYTPVANVYVVARRESDGLQRVTYTGWDGVFVFSSLPLGTWRLGFDGTGYASIPVQTSTILGYSEAGRTFEVYDTYLQSIGAAGDGNVVLTVRDGVSGNAISGATVIVGPTSGVTGYTGQVTLSVPVRIDQYSGQPMAEQIVVSAPFVDGSTLSPTTVTPVAYQTVYQTVFVTSLGAGVAGQIQASSFQTLYAGQGRFGTVTISSPQVPSYYLNPLIDPYTGYFSVQVPAGTSSFDLIFSSPYFESRVVGPIVAPVGGGYQQLSSPVVLVPERRDVQVLVYGASSSGTVTVVELGMATSSTTGAFYFPAVPVGLPLTFSASMSVPYPPYVLTSTTSSTIVAGSGLFSLSMVVN